MAGERALVYRSDFDAFYRNEFAAAKKATVCHPVAARCVHLLREKGYQLLLDTSTNQQFVVLPNEKMQQLREQVAFSFWETYDANHTVVRFTTSWSTTQADLDALAQLL